MASGDQKKKGIAMIIVNGDFVKYRKRDGAQKDLCMLREAFQHLQFDVRECYDKSKEEILDEAKKIAKMDHSQYDCLVVAISTHGKKQEVDTVDCKIEGFEFVEEVHYLAAKDDDYKTGNLTEIFYKSKCSSLEGKPKLFFVQACRGRGRCEAVTINAMDTPSTGDAENDDGGTSSFPPQPEVERIASRQQIIEKDFLVMWASPYGNVAWHHPESGSPFIYFLSEELRDHAKKSLLDILTRVNRRLATRETGNPVVSEVEHMLSCNPTFNNILEEDTPCQDPKNN